MCSDFSAPFQVQAVLLCPICPHFSEQVWHLMGSVSSSSFLSGLHGDPSPWLLQDTSVVKARWPEVGVVNPTLVHEENYFNEVLHEFRIRIKKMMDIRGKVGWVYSGTSL